MFWKYTYCNGRTPRSSQKNAVFCIPKYKTTTYIDAKATAISCLTLSLVNISISKRRKEINKEKAHADKLQQQKLQASYTDAQVAGAGGFRLTC